jgi:hypothetical protein
VAASSILRPSCRVVPFLVKRGPDGSYVDVIWTAPSSGIAQIRARFKGLDPHTSSEAAVIAGQVTLFNQNISGNGEYAFRPAVQVSPGYVIEFVLGVDADNVNLYDTTLMDISITLTSR